MMRFCDFVSKRNATDGFSTEDVLASVLPLMKQVAETHAEGLVAPLDGIEKLQVEGVRTFFAESDATAPLSNLNKVREIQRMDRGPVDIVSRTGTTVDLDQQIETQARTLNVIPRDAQVEYPAFVPGYICWEQMLDHHDPLTDIFNLGQILATLALGLDFNEPSDVETFVKNRRNLFAIRKDLHPVIARAIVRMTELHRDKRVQELVLLIVALENYRQQDVEVSVEPDDIEGFESRDLNGKQQVLLDRLQKRLFEISRRNRMLHFRSTMQSINLTQASVPLSFDYRNIRDDQILVCNRDLEQQIAGGKTISLNRHLDFASAIYLPPQLDRILRETRRDLAEYGFEQLRLVPCMLHWSDLKEQPCERYSSPLVLVPVQLKKKRGVRDTYNLHPISNDAEINPVVRYLFKQLYDIRLPERIDLETTGLDSLFEFMSEAIAKSEPAVELQKIDRPRIRLLHATAKRRLDNYRRRAHISGRGIRTFRDIDYSYDPATYHPLGVKIFHEFVKPPQATLSAIAKTMPQPRHYAIPGDGEDSKPDVEPTSPVADGNGSAEGNPNPASAEAGDTVTLHEQRFLDLKRDDGANPYDWAFDLCSVTLANFRYRKMSLVRDYEALVTDLPHSQAFEEAFSLVPRAADRVSSPVPSLADRYDVVPCDPTQATSIAQARLSDSYIVQGPPGTGKSQTITNLIADYVARGKRVLFVCEKRAAIDVVFARLRQCGLGDLCCLIHDSQADKKAFVMDLKETYESFLAPGTDHEKIESERTSHVTQVLKALQPLEEYSDSMSESTWRAGVPTGQLIERCIELQAQVPELNELQKERLPSWGEWNQGREAIETLVATLQRLESSGILARHPLRNLRADLVSDERPLQTVADGLTESNQLLDTLSDAMPTDYRELTFSQLRQWIEHCCNLMPLAEVDAIALLDESSEASIALREQTDELRDRTEMLESARERTSAWKEKIARLDLPIVLESATTLSTKWFPFLRPSWWRLRKVMNRSYDFDSHPVKPTWLEVLTRLQAEYVAEENVEEHLRQIDRQFHLAGDPRSMLDLIHQVRGASVEYPDWLKPLHHALATDVQRQSHVKLLAAEMDTLRKLRGSLDQYLDGYEMTPLADLRCELDRVDQAVDQLPDYLGCLDQLQHVPEEARVALRQMDLRPDQIEAAAALQTLHAIGRDNPRFDRFSQTLRHAHTEKLEQAHQQWMNINARFVRQSTRRKFREHVHQAAAKTASGPTEEQFRKSYTEGRKVLEHEFGKQMRYKSIRDLVSGHSGLVVRDLKPVWLMSPLSVSDTLPLGENDFDVVIFDEASQITLESSIPTLFRAGQAIVVGDEQQLPPTDFFSAKRDREEDEEITFEQEGETVSYDLESNSLLNHAARNLPSTMLGWHYRSRDEALISFSNWAFYDGRLLTIPEESIRGTGKPELVAESSEAAATNAQALFDRPVSFHHMQNGVYLRRRNRDEAEYIASLVRALLMKQDGRTIGVIAFSEAQQDEIENAIDRLAREDSEFSGLLEAELVREDDGQFVGLLVKNLENIQGDERDVIILSVCYGPDDTGRMIMNFGPINKSGGEKRLNVAFSRAKHHMAVVSSVKFSAITNEYNTGANCLRNYLRYAEAISGGDAASAESVLYGLSLWRDIETPVKPVSVLLQRIAEQLAEHGLTADFNIGNSGFRCDIGLRKEGDTKYRLGILVDAGDYYQSDVELIDRELFRPGLLKVFGWNIYSFLTKDWLADPNRIVDEIVRLCEKPN